MAGRLQFRRHARWADPLAPLVERDNEIATFERRLAEACDGAGGTVVIEAFAGQGKSRLLTIAGDMAREAQMRVLGAQATELERDFPFGVATQLFEPWWAAADSDELAEFVVGRARRVDYLFSDAHEKPRPPDDHGYSIIHGLFWLIVNLSGGGGINLPTAPLAILVDDAHLADWLSLRFLAYLAERIAELPVALVITSRRGEAGRDPRILAALRSAAHRAVLRPESLSEAGVSTIVDVEFPDADEAFRDACMSVTNGNPLLLTELIAQLRADGAAPDATTAAHLADVAPEAVLNAVVARLGSMRPAAGAVASAIAVLGSGAPLRLVARLAGLPVDEATDAADELAVRHLIHPGFPLSFVHPMVASAIAMSLSPLARANAHRRAATILLEAGEPEDKVAAHLLMAAPGSDPRAIEVLRATAGKALANGAADIAVRMLSRALDEQPGPEMYPELLAELAEAESAAGLPQAMQRLEDAIRAIDDGPRKAQLALVQSSALSEQGRTREAADVLIAALTELDDADSELHCDLSAAYIAAASYVPELADEALRLGEKLTSDKAIEPSPPQRKILAHLALQHSLRGSDRSVVGDLVARAWGAGSLLPSESPDGLSWQVLTAALLFVDELELDLEICEAALAGARERDSTSGHAAASYCRAWALYERGEVADAAADARAALDARPGTWDPYVRSAYGAMACCSLMRGELAEAETALSIIDHPDVRETVQLPFLLDVRSRLRLVQHRSEEALQDAIEAGRRQQSDFNFDSPGAIAWRSTAALAHLARGEQARARELANTELELARAAGVTRVVIRDLRVLGLASSGEEGIELLREAVRTGAEYPQRMHYIQALIDLGAALRRANQRSAARGPLRVALELSHRGGATAIANRARAELNATGARVRRPMFSGVESLTPSELRVAELAARGLTTREVAEALFVTPKTVEFHLRHIYQKLDVGSRAELKRLLGESAD